MKDYLIFTIYMEKGAIIMKFIATKLKNNNNKTFAKDWQKADKKVFLPSHLFSYTEKKISDDRIELSLTSIVDFQGLYLY